MRIYIGFSKPKNHKFPIFSWLIRLFEGTTYSHVYVRWFLNEAQATVCYEASGNEVKFICEDVYKERIQPVYEFEININNHSNLLNFCMLNAGKKYGVKQVIGILLVRLFNLKKNPFSDNRKSWVCSELAGQILIDVLKEDINLDLDIAGPKAIYEYLDKQEWAKKFIYVK